MGFKRGQKVNDSLNIGLISLTREWLSSMNITYSKIEREETEEGDIFHVDVDGDVFLADFHINDLNTIPEYIKFRNVSGRFILGNSKQLNQQITKLDTIKNMKDRLNIGLVYLTKEWLEQMDIQYINVERSDDESVFFVDVDGDVILQDFHITDIHKIPEYIKFRHVSGRFILGNGNIGFY